MHDSVRLRHPGRSTRAYVCVVVAALFQYSCERDEPPPPRPPPEKPLCPDGRSVDPPRSELRAAANRFREQAYDEAQAAFDVLAKRYPGSSSVRVWRGDAVLYDSKLDGVTAAKAALPYFQEALALQDRGCRLRSYEHYYLRMGMAYAYLRLDQPDPALEQLRLVERRWPDSAEAHYHQARAHCLKREVAACAEHFRRALEVAKSLKRPRFLRTHHSVDDWLVRSKTQSEFPPLRDDERYAAIVAEFSPERR